MKRNVTIAWLDEADPPDVAALPASLLATLDAELTAAEAAIKRRRAVLDAGMLARYAEKAAAVRGEPFGTVHLSDGDYDVRVEVPKRVEWDQAALAEACRELDAAGHDATEYVTTELKVAESRFKAWPASVQTIFAKARTTKPGKAKITLLPRKQEAA